MKAAMELKNMGIEDGYTAEVSVSRQVALEIILVFGHYMFFFCRKVANLLLIAG